MKVMKTFGIVAIVIAILLTIGFMGTIDNEQYQQEHTAISDIIQRIVIYGFVAAVGGVMYCIGNYAERKNEKNEQIH